MKKILIISFFTLLLSYSFSQNNIKDNSDNLIISGTVKSISLIDGSCYYYCKLKNISVIYGTYIEDTVTVKINPSATTLWRLKKDEQVILSVQLIKNIYEINTEYYDFSPFYSVLKLNNSTLKLHNEKDFNSLIKSYANYFKKTRILKIEEKIKAIIDYIYDKEESLPLRVFAVNDLKAIYKEYGVFYYSYIKNIWIRLYKDTNLEEKLRYEAISMIGSWTKEARFSINLITTENIDSYFMPLWKKGLTFCDSMTNKYKTIIGGYPVINDTISFSKRDNLFFSGKIKKASKNKLTIKKLKIFEGKYSNKEITIRTNIDTTFNKEIIGKNVLINATLINNKYILELKTKNRGFCKPPLTPDGKNIFFINDTNLYKNDIKIKSNEFMKIISNYYSIINSDIKNKEKYLIKNITKGKYLFLRERSLWEFSDLSLQYNSLCWDYNKKYNFLDSLSKKFGRYKAPPLTIIATADLLLTKSFNQNYSSKYNTNIYELDNHRNSPQLQRLEGFLNSKNIFAQKYAVMRFQDLIKYYVNLKKILNNRIEEYDN